MEWNENADFIFTYYHSLGTLVSYLEGSLVETNYLENGIHTFIILYLKSSNNP